MKSVVPGSVRCSKFGSFNFGITFSIGFTYRVQYSFGERTTSSDVVRCGLVTVDVGLRS